MISSSSIRCFTLNSTALSNIILKSTVRPIPGPMFHQVIPVRRMTASLSIESHKNHLIQSKESYIYLRSSIFMNPLLSCDHLGPYRWFRSNRRGSQMASFSSTPTSTQPVANKANIRKVREKVAPIVLVSLPFSR